MSITACYKDGLSECFSAITAHNLPVINKMPRVLFSGMLQLYCNFRCCQKMLFIVCL